ncbi:MAG TPA: dTDP-4-dehydrorhamnose 3,5-epimerase [Actinomycetota bacterium]
MSFRFTRLEIPDVILIEADTYRDHRGLFRETFKRSAFAEGGIDREFPQANFSRSSRDVVRGLHFQREPAAVAKLVGVAQGRIFDVAADVRPGSPTFGRWVSAELSDEDGSMLYVPEGFAHGFWALADDTLVTYLMTGEYSQEHDAGVRWNDPDLAVAWPGTDPVLSPKDQELPYLKDAAQASVGAAEEARA